LAAEARLAGLGVPEGGALILTPSEVAETLQETGLSLSILDEAGRPL